MFRVSRPAFLRVVAAAAVLGVMAFALSVLVAPPIEAAAANCTYYSSGSYTTVVGQFGYDCCNNKVAWGVKTRWSRCGGCFICFPPPR